MHSVIIQNKATYDCFKNYEPLFANAKRENRVGICTWNESGTSLETALPQIVSLTDDKEEWRAIVVRFIDEDAMKEFDNDPKNPYDFNVNAINENQVTDSAVPLIRLTQILGGIPPLEVKFEPKVIIEEHKAPRTVYEKVLDPDLDKAHQNLVNKYSYDWNPPSSIVLISVRRKDILENADFGSEWKTRKESCSSLFWQRNHYPGNCRFMVYDYDRRGYQQLEQDRFDFWLSVMLISLNDVDSSSLQAYRLYKLSTLIDRDKLSEAFQRITNRLKDAKSIIEGEIRNDMMDTADEKEDLVSKYSASVPVAVNIEKNDSSDVNTSSFKFFSKGTSTDLNIWKKKSDSALKSIEKAIRASERALDKAACKMRGLETIDDNINPLDRFQEEDIIKDSEKLYDSFSEIRGNLLSCKANKEALDKESEKVKKNLIGRIRRSSAFNCLFGVILGLVIALVPSLATNNLGFPSDFVSAIRILLIGILIVGICALIFLIKQKIKLNKSINKYNHTVDDNYSKITNNMSDYSQYMGTIASYSRAKSYLDLSKRKIYFGKEEHYSKYRYISSINKMLAGIRTWSKAHYIDVDFDSSPAMVLTKSDVYRMINRNELYNLHTDEVFTLKINDSGAEISSPFEFVKGIEISREELYDDESA